MFFWGDWEEVEMGDVEMGMEIEVEIWKGEN